VAPIGLLVSFVPDPFGDFGLSLYRHVHDYCTGTLRLHRDFSAAIAKAIGTERWCDCRNLYALREDLAIAYDLQPLDPTRAVNIYVHPDPLKQLELSWLLLEFGYEACISVSE
jgi:hypothetical protein